MPRDPDRCETLPPNENGSRRLKASAGIPRERRETVPLRLCAIEEFRPHEFGEALGLRERKGIVPKPTDRLTELPIPANLDERPTARLQDVALQVEQSPHRGTREPNRHLMGLVPISSFDRVPELAEILIRLQKVKSSGADSLLSGGSMRAASEPAQKARGSKRGRIDLQPPRASFMP